MQYIRLLFIFSEFQYPAWNSQPERRPKAAQLEEELRGVLQQLDPPYAASHACAIDSGSCSQNWYRALSRSGLPLMTAGGYVCLTDQVIPTGVVAVSREPSTGTRFGNGDRTLDTIEEDRALYTDV